MPRYDQFTGYSEKGLVDMATEDYHLGETLPRKRKVTKYSFVEFEREVTLTPCSRIDVVATCGRITWLIEFKVEARSGAIAQVLRYYEKYCHLKKKRRLEAVWPVVVAQYFSNDALRLARAMDITCIQFAPVNKGVATITTLVHADHKRFLKGAGRKKEYGFYV